MSNTVAIRNVNSMSSRLKSVAETEVLLLPVLRDNKEDAEFASAYKHLENLISLYGRDLLSSRNSVDRELEAYAGLAIAIAHDYLRSLDLTPNDIADSLKGAKSAAQKAPQPSPQQDLFREAQLLMESVQRRLQANLSPHPMLAALAK